MIILNSKKHDTFQIDESVIPVLDPVKAKQLDNDFNNEEWNKIPLSGQTEISRTLHVSKGCVCDCHALYVIVCITYN